VKDKLVYQWRQVCRNYSYLATANVKHECFKKFCNFCIKKQPSGDFCYVTVLKPSNLSDKYFYVFFDTEYTQELENVMGLFRMYRTSYVLSKCILNVKPLMI